MSQEILDAFQELKGIDSGTFSFDKSGVEALQTFLNDDNEEPSDVTVVDPDAECDCDIKDDYSGDVILQCCVCNGYIIKKPSDVVIDKDMQRANVDEQCPYCYNDGGYKIVGQVNIPQTMGDSDDITADEKEVIDVDNVTIGDDSVDESLKIVENENSINANDVAKFIKDSVNGLIKGDATNYRYKFDDRLALFVGWSDGYDENDDSYIHDKDDPSYVVVAGIKVWTSDSMWTDYDWLNYPYLENGTVLDVFTPVYVDEDLASLAKDFIDDYKSMSSKYKMDKSGKVISIVGESVQKNTYSHNHRLTERIDVFHSADNGKVTAECYTKSTRTYNYEYVDLTIGNEESTGKYRWMNRPWYRFKFSSAFVQAAKFLGYEKEAEKAVEDSHDIEEAVDKFASMIKDNSQVDESVNEGRTINEAPTYDLTPQFDRRNSFYSKARVDSDNGVDTLYSYNTKVAEIRDGKVTLFPKWNASQTTLRHVKEFLKQHGFKAESMKQIASDYTTSVEESCKKITKESLGSSNVIEFPSGDYVYVEEKDGYLVAGGATNTGIIPEYKIKIEDKDVSDNDLQKLYDVIIKKHPEYEEDMTESCKKSNKKRKIIEGISEEAYEVADSILDMIPDNAKVVSWDDFTKYFDKACKEAKVAEDEDGDFETDVRVILSYSGWETVFEGKDEGGIKRTSVDESLKNKKKLSESFKLISSLDDYEPWSGAVDTWDRIVAEEAVDRLDAYLEDAYPDGLTATELNDMLWFDGESVLADLGILSEETIDVALRDVIDDVKDEEFETFDDLSFEIEDKLKDAFDGIGAVSVDRDGDTFTVTINDKEEEFDIADFNIKNLDESLKSTVNEEVEDLWDKVYDSLLKRSSGINIKSEYLSTNKDGDIVVTLRDVVGDSADSTAKDKKKEQMQSKVTAVTKFVESKFGSEGVSVDSNVQSFGKKIIGTITIKIPADKVIDDIKTKTMEEDKSTIDESVSNIKMTTSDDVIDINLNGSDDVNVNVQSVNSGATDDAIIAPVDAETQAEIDANSGDEEVTDDTSISVDSDSEDIESTVDEFNEEEFSDLGESYLKDVYSNVANFTTTNGYINGNRIKLEGIISFKSGKKAKTSFVFEKYATTQRGKCKFIGENLQLTNRKKAFILTGSVKDKKLCLESLTYNYTAKDANGGKSLKVYGTKRISNK